MAPALVPAMCPGSVPVLCRCRDRRLGLRWSASAADGRRFQDRSAHQDRPKRTDCRIPTRLPHGRFAGLQVRLAAPGPRVTSRPVNRQHAGQPHDRTPSKAAGYVTSFGPDLVHVSGSVPRLAPAAPPCTNVNTPPATQNVHVFCTASPANANGERQRHCRPGRFLFTQGAFRRRRRRRRPGRITVVIGNAPALVPRAVAPAQTPFPITCDYTE